MKLVLNYQGFVHFELFEGENTIGRCDPKSGSNPDIDLQEFDANDQVSRNHAVIIVSQNTIILRDLGSRNGTYLNRGPKIAVARDYELEVGDEIILGKLFFTIQND